jgi:hypothetical protein
MSERKSIRQQTHMIERTSPKGPGMKFIGTCRLCGASGLSISDATKYCENVRDLTKDEALVEAITGATQS